MLIYYLILAGLMLVFMQTCHNIVSCQDVSMVLTRTALFQQEKLKFRCSPSNVARWGGVTHIILSKNTSAGFYDIVSVFLNLKTLQNQTFWHRSEWRNRATAIREYVNPVTTSSGLEFDISADNVLCSDEGTYRCKVIGSSTDNQAVHIDRFGTVKFKDLKLKQSTTLTYDESTGVIVIKWKKERIYTDTNATTTTEHDYDSTTEYHMYNMAEG
ncbi:uncharacterized protein LOC143078436 [Mytilus galloprovincialis]|uniref:uncharacterized protein LOC143078436 n=1 Tax=Mytilus galloprovincialis TaxID=29158 RepID=UPI003F7C6622